MSKKELVERVIASAGVALGKQDAAALLDAVFAGIGKTLVAEQRFAWPGFGTFTVRRRSARTGRNPRTGDVIAIAAGRTVGFRPAPALKRGL